MRAQYSSLCTRLLLPEFLLSFLHLNFLILRLFARSSACWAFSGTSKFALGEASQCPLVPCRRFLLISCGLNCLIVRFPRLLIVLWLVACLGVLVSSILVPGPSCLKVLKKPFYWDFIHFPLFSYITNYFKINYKCHNLIKQKEKVFASSFCNKVKNIRSWSQRTVNASDFYSTY